jgi:hypothetical protein
LVALVEEEQAKLLLVGERHPGPAIFDHVVPGRQRDLALDLALCHPAARGGEQFDLVDRGLADAVDLAQARDRRVDDFGERAEFFNSAFANGLVSRRGRAGNSAISSNS